jgi:hypothetical protein
LHTSQVHLKSRHAYRYPSTFHKQFLDGSGEDFSAQKFLKWKRGRLHCTIIFLMEVEKTFMTRGAVKVLNSQQER